MKMWKILQWFLVSFILLLVAAPFAYNIIENLFPTKSNITHLLKEENIALFDEFEIVRYRNELTTFHESFSIKISENDKNRIVKRLISSENYKENVDAMYDIRQENPRSIYDNQKYISSYKHDEVYGYQTFKRGVWIIIDIPERGNSLYYNKID